MTWEHQFTESLRVVRGEGAGEILLQVRNQYYDQEQVLRWGKWKTAGYYYSPASFLLAAFKRLSADGEGVVADRVRAAWQQVATLERYLSETPSLAAPVAVVEAGTAYRCTLETKAPEDGKVRDIWTRTVRVVGSSPSEFLRRLVLTAALESGAPVLEIVEALRAAADSLEQVTTHELPDEPDLSALEALG